MANTLKIKRGTNATIPQGQLAEPLFTTDTYDLYIGKGAGGNQRIQNYIASGTSSQFLKGDGSLDSTVYQATSEKGQNNGYASLDAGGKIPAAQLPSSVIEYKGTWNASTNTPTLADGTGDAGDVYIVSVGGTQNLGSGSITFDAGDWVMYNGAIWQKSTGSNAVASVNGQTGIVVLTTTNINEGTNLYFTNSRARTAISLTTTGTSGAATYDNTTGVLNIPQYQSVLTNPITGTGTTNTLPKFTGATTLGNSNVTDSGTLITLGSNSYVNGALGIGVTPLDWVTIRANKNITGNATSTGISQAGVAQSDVTTVRGFINTLSTQAASFTLTDYFHYFTIQGTIGAGSTVTNQYGFWADSSLTGATNNYGFFGNIASGANRWNLYMNGTANNYLAGALGIGTTSMTEFVNISNSQNAVTRVALTNSNAGTATQVQYQVLNGTHSASFGLTGTAFTASGVFLQGMAYLTSGNAAAGLLINTGATQPIYFGINNTEVARFASNGALGIGATGITGYNLRASKNITGAVASYGIVSDGVTQSDVTTSVEYFRSSTATQAASFTLFSLTHYNANQGTFGASSSVTNQSGFSVAANMVGATNNYGFRGLIPSGTNRWNIYMDGTAPNYMAGALGIGSTPSASITLLIGKNITGAVTSYGTYSNGTIQSDVTTNATYHATFIGTAAASFTVNNAYGHYVGGTTIGAGSAISTQQAYYVHSTLTGATNNYAFRSILAAATGVWNLYMDGTANNYLAGSLGIGTTSLTGWSLRVGKNITGATSSYGISSEGSVQSDVTTQARGFNTFIGTQATSFTLPTLYHYFASQGTFGAGSTVTNQHGFSVDSGLTGATNNYAFFSNIAAGSGRWNLYMNGTAANYLAGKLLIGSTTDSGEQLQVTGTAKITGAATFSSSVTAGQGVFSVTQATSSVVHKITSGSINDTIITDFQSSGGVTYAYLQTKILDNNTVSRHRGELSFFVRKDNASYSQALTIVDTGNVGIGTASPSSILHIQGVSGSTKFTLQPPSGQPNIIEFLTNAGVVDARIKNESTQLQFETGTSGTPKMVITSGGNVGIGTTSPAWMLELNKDTSSGSFGQYPAISVNNPNAAGYTAYYFFSGATNKGGIEYSNSTNALSIFGNGAERMRITSGGKVGINWDSPASQLSVKWDRSTAFSGIGVYDSQAYNASNHGGTITFGGTYTSGGSYTEWAAVGGIKENTNDSDYAGALALYTRPNGGGMSERMRITSGGEVLINTTTDSGAYYLQVNGSVYATAYYESSDIRLKDVLTNSYSENFSAIEFMWKDKRDEKKHWGYAAQDVMKYIPDAIEVNNDGMMTVNYNEAHTWKIAQLETKILELEAKLK